MDKKGTFMKIFNYLIAFGLICTLSTYTKAEKKQKIQGPVSRACPICPDFSCPTAPFTGTTGTTGFTGFTGPCTTANASQLCCLDVLNNITVQGPIRAECITVSNQLNVSGNTDIKDSLIVNGLSTFVDDVCMEHNLSVLGEMNVSGNVGVFGRVTVDEGAIIYGTTGPSVSGVTGVTGPALQVLGNETVTGALAVAGNQTVGQNLNVGCAATVIGLLTASGSLTVNNGSTIFSGPFIISNVGASINNTLCINGNETVSGSVTTNGITVDGNASFNNFTINPSGSLITNDAVVFNDGLTIASGDEIINAGNLTITAGDLIVSLGTTTFDSKITANGGASISGGLTVSGGQSNSVGNLDVSVGNAFLSGDVTVNGSITGGTGTLARVTLTDSTNSLSPQSGTLVVDGGVGVSKDTWVGGSIFFPNSTFGPGSPGITGAATVGVPTAFNYYEESCFATPFTWGGLTVNPPESVLIRAVRLGNIVNLIIPSIEYDNPGTHIDVVTSANALPVRFRPFTTVRGASSTIIYSAISPSGVTGVLGEYDVSPAGTITFGLAGSALGPQRIGSNNFVIVDANTITYNVDGCLASSTCFFTGT